MVIQESPICVLYMEDDEGLARLLARKLERENFQVTLAYDGKTGLELIRQNDFDVIILDQIMPGMNGLEVLKELTVSGVTIPVIMVTGMGNETIAVEAMKLGAYDYIIKDTDGGYMQLLPAVIRKAWKHYTAVQDKYKAEQALRESEEHYRELVEQANDLIYTLDLNGHIVSINTAVKNMLGYEPGEVIGQSIIECVAPEYYPFVQESIRKKTEQIETVSKYDLRLIRKDGRTIFVEVNSRLRYRNGKPFEIFGIARDITERIEAGENLRASEEKFRSLIENLGEGVGIVDHEERFRFINRAGADMFGLSMEELIGRSLLEFIPEALRRNITDQSERRRKGLKDVYEMEIIRPDGGRRFLIVTATPQFNPEREFTGTFGIFYDNTERKQAEQALRESEEKFRQAFMISPDAICINRLSDGLYKAVNQGFTDIMGYNETEILGRSSIDLDIWIDRADRQRILDTLMQKGTVSNLEARFRAKNGTLKYGLMSASIMVLNGEPHIISIIRDITERKRTELDIQLQRDLVVELLNIDKIDEVLSKAFSVLIELDEFDAGGCYLFIPETGTLRLMESKNLSDHFLKHSVEYTADSVEFQMVQQGKIIFAAYDQFTPKVQDLAGYESICSICVLPVVFGDKVIGCINLASKKSSRLSLHTRHQLEMIFTYLNTLVARIETLEALKQSEQRYKRLIESAIDYVYTIQFNDDGSVTTYHGPGCETVTGYHSDEYVKNKRLWLNMIHKDDRDFVLKYFNSIKEGNPEAAYIEHRIIHRNGRIRWVRNAPVLKYDHKGQLTGYDGMITDITEAKEYEQRLTESEHRYRNLVEAYPDGIFVEHEGKIVFANNKGVRMSGAGQMALLQNMGLKDILIREKTELLPLDKDADSNYPVISGKLKKLNGQLMDVEIVYTQTVYSGRLALLAIVRDMTEMKQLREKARLNENLAAIGQMAATIAHEIRNPLGAVSLNLQYLTGEFSHEQKYHSVLKNAGEGVRRIQSIITGILDFTRPLPPQIVEINITDVIDSALKSVQTEIDKSDIKVLKEYEKKNSVLKIDPHQISRVFINLFMNAIQAMKEGGYLKIRTEDGKDIYRIWIEDTGKGISPADIDKIFNPFFTTRADGSGLGLAIVYRILEQHHANISVESQPGFGTVFTIVFSK